MGLITDFKIADLQNVCCVYLITNPKGKKYVGQTIDLKKRIKAYNWLSCKSQVKLYRSFLKYGIDTHLLEVLCIEDSCKLNTYERYFQEKFDVINIGLNLKYTTSETKSGKLSEETRLKMRLSSLNMSDETKLKISKASKGRKISDSQKAAVSSARKGKPLKETTKLKISQSMLGTRRSENFKRTMSKLKKGSKINATHRRKLVLDTYTGVFYESCKELSDISGVKYGTIRDVVAGKVLSNKRYKYV